MAKNAIVRALPNHFASRFIVTITNACPKRMFHPQSRFCLALNSEKRMARQLLQWAGYSGNFSA